ncbi:hypothetical protein FE257_011502 [Aspergillus nanangensis]|uniref:Acyl-CoA dehydrogenase n=1 Tax=Aspergillus nanangensis TaxID=2582783 RepID=A0AAD4CHD1_ASPNN|nr:hypothetical protein FE257_011502 [Aspergillus nanangensis]
MASNPFGNPNPWSEPAWYNALASPYYTDSHLALRDFVRKYVQQYIEPYAEEWEKEGRVPPEEIIRFARSGLAFQDIPPQYRPGLSLPCNIPDEEWDIFHSLILHYEMGEVCSGVKSAIGGASIIGAPPIIHYGTEQQKSQWLPGIFTGETSFCLGATEPTGGSDLANLKTTAEKTPDGRFYIVNGHKKWITGSMTSTHMTTAVRTGGPGAAGVSVIVIPLDSEGVSIRKIHNSGCNASNAAWVTLSDVKVPRSNLIGVENQGFKCLMKNFNHERLVIAVIMNKSARVCLADALQYAHDRHTFNQPLIANQVIRAKFSTMARYIESHWAWIEQLAYHIKVTGQDADLASRLALAKVHGGRIVEMANREAQQVFGGAGYQRGGVGGRVEQISRDLRMMIVGGGSEEIIGDLAMRQELAASRKRGSHL